MPVTLSAPLENTLAALALDFRQTLPARLRRLVHDCGQLAFQPCVELRETILFELHKLAGTAASFDMPELAAQLRQARHCLQAAHSSDEEVAACDLVVSFLGGMAVLQKLPGTAAALPQPGRHQLPHGGVVLLGPQAQADTDMVARLALLGVGALHLDAVPPLPERTELLMIDVDGPDGKIDVDRLGLIEGHAGQALATYGVSSENSFEARMMVSQHGGRGLLSKPLTAEVVLDVLASVREQKNELPIRVLVVDDASELAELYQLILQSAGMEVFVEHNPVKVLQALNRYRPELLLIDQQMPAWSGQQVAAAIRSYPEFTGLPIVFLSGEDDTECQLRALILGQAEDFLVKPVRPETLVAVVLNRAQRFRSLRRLMTADSLTRLYNHVAIHSELENELARASRNHSKLSVALIDLDYFKQVNDHWGHPAGDEVLRSLADMMRHRLRRGDSIGRYGGEEFLVLMPDTDVIGATRIMEELRECFSRLPHRSGNSQFKCTFSCGIAGYPGANGGKQLVDMADKALYRAKANGRNQICADWMQFNMNGPE